MTFRALVVDDDATIRYAVRGILEQAELSVDEAVDGGEGLERVEAGDYELVVTDIQMPHMDGLELLKRIRQRAEPRPKVIIMTAHGSERQTVEAIKAGAYDYFRKPFEVNEMMAVVRRATESLHLNAEVERLSSELALSRSLIFASPAMSRLAVLVQRIGPRDVNVLITGESGTGKERIADALVQASTRSNASFVRFNCAALPTELAEAELFGHTKGAFTGAIKARAGLFREADGGTILLDEIGELPPLVQAKLLRVLQEGEVRPVGEDVSVKVDVRVIAATHRDLVQLSSEGKFREDLYYRLKVVDLRIPALRERLEDIPPLARHFLKEYSRRFGLGPFGLTPALLERLSTYSWPGNVRELENAIESLVALSHGNELDLSLLPTQSPTSRPASGSVAHLLATPVPASVESEAQFDLKSRVDAYERGVIVSALEATHGNRSLTARNLGINRTTLHGKLRKFGLSDSDTDLEGDR
jgi:two-component system, NtrC family, response regulator HydG